MSQDEAAVVVDDEPEQSHATVCSRVVGSQGENVAPVLTTKAHMLPADPRPTTFWAGTRGFKQEPRRERSMVLANVPVWHPRLSQAAGRLLNDIACPCSRESMVEKKS